MNYKIEVAEKANKALLKLDSSQRKIILKYIINVLAELPNPRNTGKALTGNKKGLWRYRIGNFRLLCQIKDKELIVLIIDIAHRKNIYN